MLCKLFDLKNLSWFLLPKKISTFELRADECEFDAQSSQVGNISCAVWKETFRQIPKVEFKMLTLTGDRDLWREQPYLMNKKWWL